MSEYQNPIGSDVVVVRGPARVGVKGYLLVVKPVGGEGEPQRIPLASIRALVLYGKSVVVSTAALSKILSQRIPVIMVTRDAVGLLESPHLTTSPEARWAQYDYLRDGSRRLALARSLAEAKVRGYAYVAKYIARRYGVDGLAEAAEEALEAVGSTLDKTRDPGEVMRVEAQAGQSIWRALRSTMLGSYKAQGFNGRNPRSVDPVNQSLNYMHAILYSIAYRAIVSAGLDPHLGALHREGYGKTPLAYDYTEQFKPIALRALLVSASTTQLKMTRSGLLSKKTIHTITSRLMKLLHSGNPTPHKQIYRHAWELRKSFMLKTSYKPYIYHPR